MAIFVDTGALVRVARSGGSPMRLACLRSAAHDKPVSSLPAPMGESSVIGRSGGTWLIQNPNRLASLNLLEIRIMNTNHRPFQSF